jgi:hypothetical protein
MRLDRQGPQEFEQADPVDDAGGAADADNQTPRSRLFCEIRLCEIRWRTISAVQRSAIHWLNAAPGGTIDPAMV